MHALIAEQHFDYLDRELLFDRLRLRTVSDRYDSAASQISTLPGPFDELELFLCHNANCGASLCRTDLLRDLFLCTEELWS